MVCRHLNFLLHRIQLGSSPIFTILTRVPGAKKGIVGSHNDPTNIEGWIMETTPTLVILEKVSPPAPNTSRVSSNRLLVGLHHLHHAAACPRLDQTCFSLLLPPHLRDKRLPMDFACLCHPDYWLHASFLLWFRFRLSPQLCRELGITCQYWRELPVRFPSHHHLHLHRCGAGFLHPHSPPSVGTYILPPQTLARGQALISP